MRVRREEPLGSMDSLLDTMTNAVGILIVIIAVTQTSVSDAIRSVRMMANIKSLNPETAREALQEMDHLEGLLDRIELQWGSLDQYMILPEGMSGEDIKRLMPDLEMVAEDPSVLPARKDVNVLSRVLELEHQVAEAQTKLEQQKARLAAKERAVQPSPKMALPVMQKVTGLKPMMFFCRDNLLYPFNADDLAKVFEQHVREVLGISKPQVEIQMADFPRLELHFNAGVIGDEFIRIRVRNLRDSLVLTFDPMPGRKGESAEQLGVPGSKFAQLIKGADPRRTCAQFYVWSDSFDLYIQAREMVEQGGVRAKWIPYAVGDSLQIQMRGDGSSSSVLESVD